MKVAHKNIDLPVTKSEIFALAKEKETASEWNEAAALYERLIKMDSLNENAYDRLMIVYRKLKDPKKELEVINSAIAAYENLYTRNQNVSAKVKQLSKALQKATGLTDKKGSDIYQPQPLQKWNKRKLTVEKLKKKKA
jgi:hypothetical protein